MTAATAESATARGGRASVLPRALGGALSAVGTVWALIGIGLFASRADLAELLPGLDAAQRATAFAELGWNPETVLSGVALVQTAMVVATGISASFILAGQRATVFHAVLATTLVAFVATATIAVAGWNVAVPQWTMAVTAATAVASGAFFSLTAYFPTGTFVPRWAIGIPIAWAAVIVFSMIVPWWESGPAWFVAAMGVLAASLIVTGIAVQVYRYRRVSDRTARQQTKWVLLALAAYVALLLPIFFFPPGSLDALAGGGGVAVQVLRATVGGVVLALVPVAIAVAIAKYRLFDVDLVIRRTVVVVLLVALIALLYAAIVGVAAAVWQGSGPIAAVVATVAAALLAHPLRVWLQRRATRWIYGERGDPYGVVARLGHDLRGLSSVEQIAVRVVDVIVDDLRYSGATLTCAPPVSITIERGDSGARIVATLPLAHDDVALGTIVVRAAPGDRPTAADQRLVSSVAAQTALALSNARAIAAVRASRERLLVTREQERQRLHRDLHDGLGPALAGARQRIELAVRLKDDRPDESTRLLAEATDAMTGMLAEVRQLVQELRPPALDELGLSEAVARATRPLIAAGGPTLEIGPAPQGLPPVVEVAAFRITVEAITNAVRHARPRSVAASFRLDEGALLVTVDDDGSGLRAGDRAGTGLESMSQRAGDLGGDVTTSPQAAGGTRVRARLPLPGGELP